MKRKKAAAKPTPEPKASPAVTDLQEFQKAHGAQWLQIIQSTPFREAMYLLNKVKLNSLTGLTNDAIEKNGREILADLRGHLQHEDDLMTLHSKTETFPVEEQEEYFSPEQVAEFEILKQKYREQNQQSRYAS